MFAEACDGYDYMLGVIVYDIFYFTRYSLMQGVNIRAGVYVLLCLIDEPIYVLFEYQLYFV